MGPMTLIFGNWRAISQLSGKDIQKSYIKFYYSHSRNAFFYFLFYFVYLQLCVTKEARKFLTHSFEIIGCWSWEGAWKSWFQPSCLMGREIELTGEVRGCLEIRSSTGFRNGPKWLWVPGCPVCRSRELCGDSWPLHALPLTTSSTDSKSLSFAEDCFQLE